LSSSSDVSSMNYCSLNNASDVSSMGHPFDQSYLVFPVNQVIYI